MFDPCPYAIALLIERAIRAGKAPAPVGFASHPPGDALGFGSFLTSLFRIDLTAINHPLLTLQKGLHRLGVMHRSRRGCHAVLPALGIATQVAFMPNSKVLPGFG